MLAIPALVSMLTVAHAGPIAAYGFGGAAIGRGQGGLAIADGGMTVFRNPALLQELAWAEAAYGYALNRSAFPAPPPLHWDTNRDGQLDDADDPLTLSADRPRADGSMVSMARNVGDRMGVALNAFMPTDQFLRLRTTEPALPAWVMHGNRTQRLELAVGLGVEVVNGFSIGIASEMVGKAKYRINGTIDIAAGAATDAEATADDLIEYVRVDVHEMTLDLVPRLVPMLGVHWDVGTIAEALQGTTLAATWRGSSGVPVEADIDLQINGRLAEVGDLESVNLALVIPVELSIFDHFVPERWSVGMAYQHNSVRIYADAHRTRWSAMQVNVAHLSEAAIRSQMFQVDEDSVDDANDYSVEFRDTTSVHSGFEVRLPTWRSGPNQGPVELTIRGGGAYIPSPLTSQGASTAFLDSDRFLVSGGIGLVHRDALDLVPGPVAWDAYVSQQRLAEGALIPDGEVRPGSPIDGRPIPVGGQMWSAGVQGTVSF